MATPLNSISRKSTRQGAVMIDQKPETLVPIYGMTEVPIAKSTQWDVIGSYVSSAQIMSWLGDDPAQFCFSWKLVAGTNQDVATRESLITYTKRLHAMVAFTKTQVPSASSFVVLPPPRVKLILGDYVSAVGVLTNVEVTAIGPFTNDGSSSDATIGNMNPSAINCKITFICQPGYKNGVLVDTNTSAVFDSDSVLDHLYRVT